MATITFKAKVRDAWPAEAGAPALYQFLQVPELRRSHCDMPAFRLHARYGGLANSDLFPNVLTRVRRDITQPGGILRLDMLPANVAVDRSGFLAVVTVSV